MPECDTDRAGAPDAIAAPCSPRTQPGVLPPTWDNPVAWNNAPRPLRHVGGLAAVDAARLLGRVESLEAEVAAMRARPRANGVVAPGAAVYVTLFGPALTTAIVLALTPDDLGGYAVSCPGRPGLCTQGETVGGCVDMALDAAAELLKAGAA